MAHLISAGLFGSFLLTGLLPAAERSASVTTAEVVVRDDDKLMGCSSRMSDDSAPPGRDLVSCDDFGTNGEKQLPQRFAERTAGRIGLAAGATFGPTIGFVAFGPVGAVIGGALFSIAGEVFAEWVAANFFRGSSPYTPRMNTPLVFPTMPNR